jgi:hypothetical protein
MSNQDLLTIFVALTGVAALLQTGIIVGIYIAARKLEKRTDHVSGELRRVLNGPADQAIESLQQLSLTMAEYAALTQEKLRQLEQTLNEKEPGWQERVGKYKRPA